MHQQIDVKPKRKSPFSSNSTPFWQGAEIGSLEFDREIRAVPSKVFPYFSSPKLLTEWLAPRVSVDFREGGVFVLSWGMQGRVTGEFLEIVPNQLLRFIWEDSLSAETMVTVAFKSFAAKTRLKLVHQLFGGATKADWNEGHLNEWVFFLDNLRSIVESGADLRPRKSRENGWGWILGSYSR